MPALQHCPATQRPRLQATSARNLHPDGPQARHALKIKSDHLSGALHRTSVVTEQNAFEINHIVPSDGTADLTALSSDFTLPPR